MTQANDSVLVENQRRRWRESRARFRANHPREKKLKPPLAHGNSAYSNGLCKCDICRAARREYQVAHRSKNPDRVNEYSRTAYRRDPRRALERKRRWEARHPDYWVKYYARPDVRDRATSRMRRWRVTEKGRLRTIQERLARRARETSAPGVATASQIKARIDYYGGLCWVCGVTATTVDHVVPLARGGSNWPANLRPACKRCNFSRGARF